MIIYLLGLVGVAVSAVGGALAAGRRNYDWVGVCVIGFVAALGGGTLRDLLLNRPVVFWIADPLYLWIPFGSCFFTLLYVKTFRPPRRALVIADALGLALFTLSGAQIAEQQGVSAEVILLMGAVTGSAGGVLRDVLTGTTPLLFSPNEPLYSLASIFGVSVYLILEDLGADPVSAFLTGFVAVAALRIAAIFWNIRLPAFRFND